MPCLLFVPFILEADFSNHPSLQKACDDDMLLNLVQNS